MEHTATYGLTQWSKSDRIEMEEFNSNNLKTEQALSGLQAALTAVQAQQSALQETCSRQLLKSLSVTASRTSYDIPMSDIDWTQWKLIHVVINATTESGYSIYLSDNDNKNLGTGNANSSGTAENSRNVAHYILLPQYEPRLTVLAFNLGSGTMARGGTRYSALSYLRVACDNSTYKLLSGTTIQVWGEH